MVNIYSQYPPDAAGKEEQTLIDKTLPHHAQGSLTQGSMASSVG